MTNIVGRKNIFKMLMVMIILSPITLNAQVNQNKILFFGVAQEVLTLPKEGFKQIKKIIDKSKSKKLLSESTQSQKSYDLSCNLWENNPHCSCEEVCPNSYEILRERSFSENLIEIEYYDPETSKIIRTNSLDTKIPQEVLFSFGNDVSDFQDINPRTFGYCWGYSHLWRRLKTLAFFEPQHKKDSLEEIKLKIKKIIRSAKPQVFNGYSSLHDLSSDPDIKYHLQKKTVQQWRKKAVNIDGLGVFLKGKMTSNKVKTFIENLKRNLSLGMNPMIYFSSKSDHFGIHVVPVYRLQQENDLLKICFIDNHGTAEEQSNCGANVEVNLKDYSLSYEPWLENNELPGTPNLKSIGFTQEDRSENLKFVKTLKPYCEKITQCKK